VKTHWTFPIDLSGVDMGLVCKRTFDVLESLAREANAKLADLLAVHHVHGVSPCQRLPTITFVWRGDRAGLPSYLK
jgi:hypothetical protein